MQESSSPSPRRPAGEPRLDHSIAPTAPEWPLVTGVFLSFNTGAFVVAAIESVLASGYPNLELICIDDASTDGVSVPALLEFRDTRGFGSLTLNARNLGITRNLNNALEQAHGKYLFFIGDDLVTESKIWDDVRELESLGEDFAVVHSLMQDVDSDGVTLLEPPHPGLPPTSLPDDPSFDEVLRNDGYIAAPTAMMRRASLESVGGWDESLMYEDKPMWFALAHRGYRFRFRPVVSVFYRRHSGQATARVREGSIAYQMRVFRKYDTYPQAQRKMRRILMAASAARLDGITDLDECMRLYGDSQHRSRVLYLAAKWGVLTRIAAVRRRVRARGGPKAEGPAS